MYENNNTVTIDWKGLFIKIIFIALIVFLIFKGYEYFNNKKENSSNTSSTSIILFNANLESLKQSGENYFDYNNYPSEGQTKKVYLSELIAKGEIKELVDEKGNVCSGTYSYVEVTNENGQYKLKTTLSCGENINYTVDTIGCECEENVCSQNNEDEREETTNKENKENKQTTKASTKKATKNKTTTKKDIEEPITRDDRDDEIKTTAKPIIKKTTSKTTKKHTTTTKITTTTKQSVKNYRVMFDSNGGDKVATQYVEKYETAIEPTKPEKEDARFAGWYYKGELFDFDTEITKDITLEAYYWETKTLNKVVYSAAWGAYGKTYVTVSHKLAIPYELQKNNIKNVRIKDIQSERTMSSANDLYYHSLYHRSTYDGYKYEGNDYKYDEYAGYTLARLYNINAKKTYSYTYDRWVTWTAYVGNQCAATFDGTNCNYGIVYTTVWEYDEFTD